MSTVNFITLYRRITKVSIIDKTLILIFFKTLDLFKHKIKILYHGGHNIRIMFYKLMFLKVELKWET